MQHRLGAKCEHEVPAFIIIIITIIILIYIAPFNSRTLNNVCRKMKKQKHLIKNNTMRRADTQEVGGSQAVGKVEEVRFEKSFKGSEG